MTHDEEQYAALQDLLDRYSEDSAELGGTTGRFNLNAEEFMAGRPAGTEFEFEDVPVNELLGEVEDIARELMPGNLPQDVADEIRRHAAESSLQGGISGQLARNLTARDIGRTSLEMKQLGASLAAGVAELQIKESQFNASMRLQAAEFNESLRQWNDKFATLVVESDQNADRIALAGLELESRNRQFVIGQEAAIMMANADREVPGGQDFIDSLADRFGDVTELVSRYTS
jgi:hypothetical protein